MRIPLRALAALSFVGCGGQNSVSEPPVEELAAEPPPPPLPPTPSCPFDLEAVRAGATVMNYAIEGQSEASLRVWPDQVGDATSIRYRYERRDENGREVGIEDYRCSEFGLSLVEAGPERGTIRFDPPLLVLPVLVESGEASGLAILREGVEDVTQLDYLHTFEAIQGSDSEFEGERTGVASTLSLGEPASSVVSTETTWVHAPGFLAAVARTQEFDDGRSYAERLRTIVPSVR